MEDRVFRAEPISLSWRGGHWPERASDAIGDITEGASLWEVTLMTGRKRSVGNFFAHCHLHFLLLLFFSFLPMLNFIGKGLRNEAFRARLISVAPWVDHPGLHSWVSPVAAYCELTASFLSWRLGLQRAALERCRDMPRCRCENEQSWQWQNQNTVVKEVPPGWSALLPVNHLIKTASWRWNCESVEVEKKAVCSYFLFVTHVKGKKKSFTSAGGWSNAGWRSTCSSDGVFQHSRR